MEGNKCLKEVRNEAYLESRGHTSLCCWLPCNSGRSHVSLIKDSHHLEKVIDVDKDVAGAGPIDLHSTCLALLRIKIHNRYFASRFTQAPSAKGNECTDSSDLRSHLADVLNPNNL